MHSSELYKVDHLAFAVKNLDEGVGQIADLLGVKPQFGGQHLGRGTHNALLALGPKTYLEIIAPDPHQAVPTHKRWLGVDDIKRSGITAWAAKSSDIQGDCNLVRSLGVRIGDIQDGSRITTDGDLLEWQLTTPETDYSNGVVPFLIDWKDSIHPAESLNQRGTLINLLLEHPEASKWNQVLLALQIPIQVIAGDLPKISILVESPNGLVEIK